MTAQIRPNRMEVNDRFPMLGFSVRVDEPNVEAEVVLANDISLFDPQNKARRNASNFYTSREHGTLMVPRGDGVFVVAPTVLARFIGSDKLYFGLATGRGSIAASDPIGARTTTDPAPTRRRAPADQCQGAGPEHTERGLANSRLARGQCGAAVITLCPPEGAARPSRHQAEPAARRGVAAD